MANRNAIDTVLATCVFRTVPHPVLGQREARLADLTVEQVEPVKRDLVRLICARP